MLRVLETGPQLLFQDRGRSGVGSLGVATSGAFDRMSAARANHAMGNQPDATVLEVLFGGTELLALRDVQVIMTGMKSRMLVTNEAGAQRAHYSNSIIDLGAGERLSILPADVGMRGYLAVRGGFQAKQVLGSASHDVMSHLGPAPISKGEDLPIGDAIADPAWWPLLRDLPSLWPPTRVHDLTVVLGPRADWFTAESIQSFFSQTYEVAANSNRIGIRFGGDSPLQRQQTGELASEGMTRGAIQVPPEGFPIAFGPDYPVTGGYPVIGVLTMRSSDYSAQLSPGDHVRFHPLKVR
ncbi:biotin-dependent carboxyltransferase family protein [Corynebacterium sp. H127]|uniref:5-oxoprolinase subunit C family protein n=1 Tax=Corynebacterium sp. H127 TaxID=3133418 RepID=UPI0030AB9361